MSKCLSMIAVLGTFSLAAACGSDQAATGAGGSTGTGGTSGTVDTGGTGGAAGGRDDLARDCTAANTSVAPSDGLIADFTDTDGGINLVNGELAAFPNGSSAVLTYSTTGAALHVTGEIGATSQYQYPNMILGFGSCIDATAFSGVQFSISGSYSGCTMQYATADVEHQDETSGAPAATGPLGSYPPQTTIPPTQLTSTPQTLRMPFGAPASRGNPATPLDKAKLIFALWQFTVAPATGDAATSCVVDITVDDVRFY
jgi:hypothetical protein